MSDLVNTRRSLHAVAELVLAGPQYAAHETIMLAVNDRGFATVRDPVLVVTGPCLVSAGRELELDGRSVAAVAADAGVTPRALRDVYPDGCGLDSTHVLTIDSASATEIVDAFTRGDQALAAFAPDERRILWPEHFDIGITRKEVNYGVSPGDAFLPVPYAYVGPWNRDQLDGPFWNAPFGAARPVSEIDDVEGFFKEGHRLLKR
jgi:hypothetical protein